MLQQTQARPLYRLYTCTSSVPPFNQLKQELHPSTQLLQLDGISLLLIGLSTSKVETSASGKWGAADDPGIGVDVGGTTIPETSS